MDFKDEYQIYKTKYINDYEYKNTNFLSYKEWLTVYTQTVLFGANFTDQNIVDSINHMNSGGNVWLNERRQENAKLSIKERLRKKLEEKKRLKK
jgi:hypothetical protein